MYLIIILVNFKFLLVFINNEIKKSDKNKNNKFPVHCFSN